MTANGANRRSQGLAVPASSRVGVA
jgi:hypothetical protein